MEVARRRASQHRQRLIDVLRLFVAGNDTAGGVCFFDQVVAVVGVDACAAGQRLVDAPAEGVVFKADCATGSGQRDAAQAVLEVPGIARGV